MLQTLRLPRRVRRMTLALVAFPPQVARVLWYTGSFLNKVLGMMIDWLADTRPVRYFCVNAVHPVHCARALRNWPWTPIPLRPPETRTLH